jgi:hypothetical protein
LIRSLAQQVEQFPFAACHSVPSLEMIGGSPEKGNADEEIRPPRSGA